MRMVVEFIDCFVVFCMVMNTSTALTMTRTDRRSPGITQRT